MQRIKPMNPEGSDQLAATYERITATRGYLSERQITVLTLLCGYLVALSTTITAFRIELEPSFAPKAKRA